MKVLVTGGMGFIGRHTVDELLEQGHDVVVYDRAGRESQWPSDRVSTFLGDIRDQEAVTEAVRQCDAVINLAGILGTMETIDDPYPSVDTNIKGALNIFQACRPFRTRSEGIRAVQISVGNYFMNNSYAITKHAAERLALMFNEEHGTKIAVVRGLNAYGEGQKHSPVRKIVPNFALRALTGRPIEIFGDGSQVMDMIYVRDLARVLVNAASKDHDGYSTVMDAGMGRPSTVSDIAQLIAKYSGTDAGVAHLPMRPGEPEGSVVLGDPSTLKPLDINPDEFVSLEEGLERTVEWYRVWLAENDVQF